MRKNLFLFTLLALGMAFSISDANAQRVKKTTATTSSTTSSNSTVTLISNK